MVNHLVQQDTMCLLIFFSIIYDGVLFYVILMYVDWLSKTNESTIKIKTKNERSNSQPQYNNGIYIKFPWMSDSDYSIVTMRYIIGESNNIYMSMAHVL